MPAGAECCQEQVVADAGGQFGDDVCGGGCDDGDVRPVCKAYMPDFTIPGGRPKRGIGRLAGKSLECLWSHKLAGVLSQYGSHRQARAGQFGCEVGGLVCGDAACYAEQDVFAGGFCVFAFWRFLKLRQLIIICAASF